MTIYQKYKQQGRIHAGYYRKLTFSELLERDRERFYSKILFDKSGCWLWQASIGTGGYGKYHDKELGHISAHRYSWIYHNGYSLVDDPLIAEFFVCHTCDVRRCVNPKHLFLGTQKENMQDCSRKGRISRHGSKVRGESHGMSSVSWSSICYIRKSTKTPKQLAEQFEMSLTNIYDILNYKIWRAKS